MVLKYCMEIGERIEVIKKHHYLDDAVGYSMVWDMIHEDEVAITLPMYATNPVILNAGDRVEVLFFRDYCCYSFSGEVMNRYKVGEASIINIKQRGPIERIQRRKFFRLKVVLPLTFKILGDSQISEDNLQGEKVPVYKGYCMDISGGGLKLVTNQELGHQTLITCCVPLLDGAIIDVKGKVIRTLPLEGLALKYGYGIAFVDIDPKTQDKLIKFVFEKQRDLICKDMEQLP